MKIICPCCGKEFDYKRAAPKQLDVTLLAKVTAALPKATDYSINIVRKASRYRWIVDVRCCIAKILFENGMSTTQIGEFINRNRATVINMLKRFDDTRKYVQKTYDAIKEEMDKLEE